MNILIAGDTVPTKSNYDAFKNGDLDSLVGAELKELFRNADYRICNLEAPLTDVKDPIDKGGHNMAAPTETVNGLSALGIDLCTLANNHILDQNEQGLFTTCQTLKDRGISFVGVGTNLEEAARPYIASVDGKKIGIYACAEHEFSIAAKDRAGANPFEPLFSLDHIAALREQCDYLIVLYHGGKEQYPYPSPQLQTVSRRLADKGADLVLCQHSHCIGCKEEYGTSTIVYGQGNFLFNENVNEYWRSGLLVQIGDGFEIRFLPIVMKGNGIELAKGETAEKIMAAFQRRSEEIQQPGFIEDNYRAFAKKATGYYFLEFTGRRLLIFMFRALNKLSGQRLMRRFSWTGSFRGRHYCAMRNYIECEAHRELILAAMSDKH